MICFLRWGSDTEPWCKGINLLATCSGGIGAGLFQKIIAAADHPVLLSFPEGV